jgi:four helix bundle protein
VSDGGSDSEAEGHERGGERQFAHFLAIAKGSCGELRAQLYTAQDAGYLTASAASELRSLASQLSRQLSGMRAKALAECGSLRHSQPRGK